jgi:hypothetical protein
MHRGLVRNQSKKGIALGLDRYWVGPAANAILRQDWSCTNLLRHPAPQTAFEFLEHEQSSAQF